MPFATAVKGNKAVVAHIIDRDTTLELCVPLYFVEAEGGWYALDTTTYAIRALLESPEWVSLRQKALGDVITLCEGVDPASEPEIKPADNTPELRRQALVAWAQSDVGDAQDHVAIEAFITGWIAHARSL